MEKLLFRLLLLVSIIPCNQIRAQYQVQATVPPFNGNFNTVFFTDAFHGWTAGDSGAIYRYDGNTWTLDSSGTNLAIHSLCFIDSLNGWAVGDQGLILRYRNHTWQQVPGPVSFDLNSVSFSDSTHGWAVGFDGVLQYTAADGWTQVNAPVNSGLGNGFMLDSLHAWAGGIVGFFYEYNNFNWQAVNYWWISTFDVIIKIYFKNLYEGWIIGTYYSNPNNMGNFIESWDGFEWHLEDYYPTYHPLSFSIYHDWGWFVGQQGSIVCRDDMTLWNPQQSGTNESLNDVFFINAEEGWIVGDHGIILHTLTGGFTGIDYVNDPTTIKIYPNPTTGEIKLMTNCKADEQANLQVRDGSGRLLQSASIELQSGFNHNTLDISAMAAGTYLVTLTTASGIYHQKIIKSR